MAMELLQGGSLFDLMQKGRLPLEEAVYIVDQILAGLEHAHERGVVHRDLKLANIMLKSSDLSNMEVKISDFGFATFFDPASGLDLRLGSPFYMAPEV